MNVIRVDLKFASDNPDPDTFDSFLDAVADEFHAIRQEELDYSASLASYTAAFTVPAAGTTIDAIAIAIADLRTAIHATGGGTPGWPTDHEIVRWPSMEICAAN